MTTKQITLRWLNEMEFEAENQRGHTMPVGQETGFRPTEILLVALAGCTAMDVVSILQKKRQPVKGVEVLVHAEQLETHPKRFVRFDVEYVVKGVGVAPAAVERAIELSTTKYCSVQATLQPAVEIHHTYRIEEDNE